MFVVGTAGHVDHGKSTLVYRLTGMDPDRLAEEKQRGMTIDLGFAWLTLPSGREISIVDVPGHERFVKNMLAGVGGIDVAMLVVAADEGVMPQTREHLAILDLLGVTRGLIALTKRDLVDADWLALVADDVRGAVTGTTLDAAPLVPVSALSGAGVPELLAALDALLGGVPAHDATGAPRLPIDRVFTLSGHGTVVTGTLLDGPLRVGEEVEILPSGLRSRVRSLQTHRQRVEVAPPGTRVAANLVGLDVGDLRRGDTLVRPGSLQPTTTIDVSLRLLASAGNALQSGDTVMLYTGAAEIPAVARIIGEGSEHGIAPEGTGHVQLRLVQPAVARRGDRFIIRRPSPPETLGGGEILDPQARRARRGRAAVALREDLGEDGLLEEALRSRRLWSVAELAARVQESPERTAAGLAALQASGRAVAAGDAAASPEGWQALSASAARTLRDYHVGNPLRAGMPREEVRERLGVPSALWPAVAARLAQDGAIAEQGAALRLPDFLPRPTAAQERRIGEILDALAAGGVAPPALSELVQADDAPLLAYLQEQRRLIRLNEQLAYPTERYRAMVEQIVTALEGGPITVAEVRDLFDVSRRYSLALLEHLDTQRVTRRVGDRRTLLRRPDWLGGKEV